MTVIPLVDQRLPFPIDGWRIRLAAVSHAQLLVLLLLHTLSAHRITALNCSFVRLSIANNGADAIGTIKMLDIVAAAQDANIGKFGVGQKHTNSLLDEKADEDDIDDAFQLAEISPISELFDDFSFTGAAKKHQQQQCPSNSSQYCILIKCKAIGGTLQDCFEPNASLTAEDACKWIVNRCQQHKPDPDAYCRACARPHGCTTIGENLADQKVPEDVGTGGEEEKESGSEESANNNGTQTSSSAIAFKPEFAGSIAAAASILSMVTVIVPLL